VIFEKYNNNPKGWKTNDCVIRSISQALGKSWLEVYDDLCEIGKKKCRMPNDKAVFELYLTNNGFIKHKQPRHSDGSKYTVRELADLLPNDDLIISVTKHLTFMSHGTLVDSWNCGGKTVGNYYSK